jgi:hypothetical protein
LNGNTIPGLVREPAPEDFDGHTEFDRLSPEQKLLWLSDAARFIHEARRIREQSRIAAMERKVQSG